jgi:hypothetical protein
VATITIPSTLIQANTLRRSTGTVVPDFTHAEITLVDTNNQWGATPDPTRHVVRWGLQISTDGGQTWAWGPVMQEEPNGGLPFGSRSRTGGMPALTVDRDDIPSGVQVALAIETDAQIRLGAAIVTA